MTCLDITILFGGSACSLEKSTSVSLLRIEEERVVARYETKTDDVTMPAKRTIGVHVHVNVAAQKFLLFSLLSLSLPPPRLRSLTDNGQCLPRVLGAR